MELRLLTAALLVIAITACPAHAKDRKGWGVAAGIGVSKIRDRDSSGNFNGSDTGYSLEGEYRFTPNFALGLSIFDLGKADDTVNSVPTTIEVDGFGFFVRGIIPVSNTVDIYGRLGRINYEADVTPGGSTGLFGEDANEIGAGVDIGHGEHFSYRIEGRYFDGPRDESGALFTVGLSYRF